MAGVVRRRSQLIRRLLAEELSLDKTILAPLVEKLRDAATLDAQQLASRLAELGLRALD